MKFIKENTNANQIKKKNKELKESLPFKDDCILNEIEECLDSYEILTTYLTEYISDRVKVLSDNSFDMAALDRSEVIGQYLVRAVNAIEDICFNACEFIDLKAEQGKTFNIPSLKF